MASWLILLVVGCTNVCDYSSIWHPLLDIKDISWYTYTPPWVNGTSTTPCRAVTFSCSNLDQMHSSLCLYWVCISMPGQEKIENKRTECTMTNQQSAPALTNLAASLQQLHASPDLLEHRQHLNTSPFPPFPSLSEICSDSATDEPNVYPVASVNCCKLLLCIPVMLYGQNEYCTAMKKLLPG